MFTYTIYACAPPSIDYYIIILYVCTKHYINDCAAEKFQLGHVAVLCGRFKYYRAHAHPDRTCDSLPKKLITCVASSLTRALKPKVESPPSIKHSCITSTPESSSFAVTGLPHVSLLFDLILFSGSYAVLLWYGFTNLN